MFNGLEYLRPNKNWIVRVLKCLDHDHRFGSTICTLKIVDPSNILYLTVHLMLSFCATCESNRSTLDFWFLGTSNDVEL